MMMSFDVNIGKEEEKKKEEGNNRMLNNDIKPRSVVVERRIIRTLLPSFD